MKNAKELAHYTQVNLGAMREWCNREYKHAEGLLNMWIKESNIKSRKDNDLVSDIVTFDLHGDVIVQNYMRALIKCQEPYTMDTVTGAIDIVLQEMAENLTYHMRTQYPCLRRTHYVVMRANKFCECVMYIGPYNMNSQSAYHLFGDEGVFMTQGLTICMPLTENITLFQ